MEMRYQGHNFATSPAGNLFVNEKFSDVSERCGASIPLDAMTRHIGVTTPDVRQLLESCLMLLYPHDRRDARGWRLAWNAPSIR